MSYTSNNEQMCSNITNLLYSCPLPTIQLVMKGKPNKPQNQRGEPLYFHLLSQLRNFHMVVHLTPNHPMQNQASSSLLIVFIGILLADCLAAERSAERKDNQTF